MKLPRDQYNELVNAVYKAADGVEQTLDEQKYLDLIPHGNFKELTDCVVDIVLDILKQVDIDEGQKYEGC